ncbi:MAG: nucleoside hydrolase [Methylocystis sp.]|jgi:inosine-uridine nucleoside N-ribohydrolase
MRSLVIFTDATEFGDDLIAIAMLATAPGLRVEAVVATPGNVWAEQAAQNARVLLTKLRREDVRVCVGMAYSEFKEQPSAFIHELGSEPAPYYSGAFALGVPEASREMTEVGELFSIIASADRPDLLVIGPCSAVARLVTTYPNLAEHVGRVYLMGGLIAGAGNTTRVAEFNFWFDPEAADRLLASNVPITLLPLDPTRGVDYPASFRTDFKVGDPGAEHLNECLARRPLRPVCDELLAAVVLDQSVVAERRRLAVAVETIPGPRYGAMRLLDDDSRRPVDVIEKVDLAKFWNLMHRVFAQPDSAKARVHD